MSEQRFAEGNRTILRKLKVDFWLPISQARLLGIFLMFLFPLISVLQLNDLSIAKVPFEMHKGEKKNTCLSPIRDSQLLHLAETDETH